MPRRPAVADDGIRDEVLPGLPQDPEPAVKRGPGRPRGSTTKKAAAKIAVRGPDGRAVSKSAIKEQVRTEIYGFATLAVGMWSIRDPECAGVMTEGVAMPNGQVQERLAAIVDQTVEILARNDKVLSVLATGGVIGQLGMLASLLWPVGKHVWAAHGPGGHGHQVDSEVNGYADRYPAPALA